MSVGDIQVLPLKSICGTESPTLTLCGWRGGGDFIPVGSLCSRSHNAFNLHVKVDQIAKEPPGKESHDNHMIVT